MTKMCHSRDQDDAGFEGIPVYGSLRVNVVFIVVSEVGFCVYDLH